MSRIPKKKRVAGMFEVVEHLPNKCKALSSSPSTSHPPKKRKKEGRNEGREEERKEPNVSTW
jgi:hypothetical protein